MVTGLVKNQMKINNNIFCILDSNGSYKHRKYKISFGNILFCITIFLFRLFLVISILCELDENAKEENNRYVMYTTYYYSFAYRYSFT